MRRAAWVGVGVVATLVVAMAVTVIPGSATGVQSLLGVSTSTPSSSTNGPAWNSGNLCGSISYGPGPGDVNCVSDVSNSPTPLSYNFSAGSVQGGIVNVTIYGSNDCIYLNFHSFYTTLNINLLGSGYKCTNHSGKGGGGWDGEVTVSGVDEWNNEHGCSSDNGWTISSGLSADWGGGKKSCSPASISS